jgi:L-2,4-diaminobutyric acid acetyltransferase
MDSRHGNNDSAASPFQIRQAARGDATTIWRFVETSGQLDRNSYYCYVVLTELFPTTCLIAQDQAARPVGFVTAVPTRERPGELFIWQLYVEPAARGQGLGRTLLWAAVTAAGASVVRATVIPGNQAASNVFAALARQMGLPITTVPYLSPADFPAEEAHPAEDMVIIGQAQ